MSLHTITIIIIILSGCIGILFSLVHELYRRVRVLDYLIGRYLRDDPKRALKILDEHYAKGGSDGS